MRGRWCSTADAALKSNRPRCPPIHVAGPWQVSFPPNLGAPASAQFDKLISWSEHREAGIRFFSGTATYRTKFTFPDSAFRIPRSAFFLDLATCR